MSKKEVIVLKDKWNTNALDAPHPRGIESIAEESRISPFPLTLQTQKTLLELIYNRKSGIITRQELIDVLFNKEDDRPGKIYRSTL